MTQTDSGADKPSLADVRSGPATPLSNSVLFRATAPEAHAVFMEVRTRLVGRPMPTPAPPNGAVVGFSQSQEIMLDGGARGILAVSPFCSPEAASPDTYCLSLILQDSGDDIGRSTDLLRSLGHLPFTPSELSTVRKQLPLTRTLPAMVKPHALGHVDLFLTIHHMTDFLVMMETLNELGVSGNNVTIIDKEYPYLLTRRVDAHLRHRFQARVFLYSDIETAIVKHVEAARRRGRRTLVIDDGGYVFPVVFKSCPELLPDFIGLVEQTVSGIWKLASLPPLPVPLFSVAESNLKATIESYGIADAAVRNVLSLLPQEKLEGQPALVIGFGRIGQELANVLRSRRMHVAVFDRELVRLVAAHERGFLTSDSLSELVAHHRPLVIGGTTGGDAMVREHFEHVRRDCFAFSVTSRDREFNLRDLAELSVDVAGHGRLGREYTLASGPRITVLANGFPVNFHYAESLPNKYVDIVLASLLLGACTLAGPDHGFQSGDNLAKTNAILDHSHILRRYYELYRPRLNGWAEAKDPQDWAGHDGARRAGNPAAKP